MDEEVRQRDTQNKQELKGYHDTRHRAKEHKFKVGDAVLLKREKKLKGETPFEPYVYIATKVIGSTIHAKRVNDQKTECGDPSKSSHSELLVSQHKTSKRKHAQQDQLYHQQPQARKYNQ